LRHTSQSQNTATPNGSFSSLRKQTLNRRFEPIAILEGDFHPALQQAVRDLFAREAMCDLRRHCADDNAEAIAKAAQRLVDWTGGSDRPVKVRFAPRPAPAPLFC
jgi:hypothetical protein